jgi:hypothetical protein
MDGPISNDTSCHSLQKWFHSLFYQAYREARARQEFEVIFQHELFFGGIDAL